MSELIVSPFFFLVQPLRDGHCNIFIFHLILLIFAMIVGDEFIEPKRFIEQFGRSIHPAKIRLNLRLKSLDVIPQCVFDLR